MPRIEKLSRIILLSATLFIVLAVNAGATTLYQQSLEKLKARVEQASPGDYTFVVLGDSRDDDAVFKKALTLARSFKPLFILHGGDYSGTGSARETDHFLSLVKGSIPDIPIFVVMGNHENRKVFADKIGPLDFTLESARLNLKLVVVDNSDYKLKVAEQAYLHNRLAGKRENSFVAMHVPPKTARWNWHTFSEGATELEKLLAENGVKAAFYAHVHLYDRDVISGVPSIITGGAGAPLVRLLFPGDPVYHIVVVKVKNGKVTTEMVKLAE